MTTELIVRQFQTTDTAAVVALWEAELPSSRPWNEPRQVICRKQQRNDHLFFVGELNGSVIGTVLAGYDGIRGWIYALAVSPDVRRQGIGGRLLAAAEQALAVQGCLKINLQVRADNRAVVGFYERCGYLTEDRVSLGKALPVDLHAIVDPVPTIIVTDEFRLSQMIWEDKPALTKYLNQTAEFRQHMFRMPYPYTEIDAEQWLLKLARQTLAEHHERHWAIRNAAGELIGGVGVLNLIQGEAAELGYWLAKPYWGRGIVTAVVRRLCQFVCEHYPPRKIFARVFQDNSASARVLEKAGFEWEGTLQGHVFRDGEAYDLRLFGWRQPV